MRKQITLIKGDGIGPEIADSVLSIIDSAGAKIYWDIQKAGADITASSCHFIK